MSDILASVVLAVYNVEKYLDRSVESVLSQTYKNLELILVDDGSPDACPSMCDAWAERDLRIRVIHKENGGLSSARNAGIEAARGKYIFFFDSDDFIEPCLVERCVKAACDSSAQMVVYGYDRLDRNGRAVARSVPEMPKSVMRGQEIRDFVIPCLAGPMIVEGKKYHILSSAWGGMYSTELIKANGFRFVSEREIISEDIYSNLIYYQYVECFAIIHEVLYHYCENNADSLTRTYNPKRFERNKHFYKEAISLCDKLGYSEAAKKNLSNQMMSNVIASIKQTLGSDMTKKQKKQELGQILKDQTTRKVLSDYDLRLDKSIFRKLLIGSMREGFVSIVSFLVWIKSLI